VISTHARLMCGASGFVGRSFFVLYLRVFMPSLDAATHVTYFFRHHADSFRMHLPYVTTEDSVSKKEHYEARYEGLAGPFFRGSVRNLHAALYGDERAYFSEPLLSAACRSLNTAHSLEKEVVTSDGYVWPFAIMLHYRDGMVIRVLLPYANDSKALSGSISDRLSAIYCDSGVPEQVIDEWLGKMTMFFLEGRLG